MKKKAHYPKDLHNTHLIPSISQREKGIKPVERVRKNYKHFTGPEQSICQYPGTEVLDPFKDGLRIKEEEVIYILTTGDPRRRSRSKDAHESESFKH